MGKPSCQHVGLENLNMIRNLNDCARRPGERRTLGIGSIDGASPSLPSSAAADSYSRSGSQGLTNGSMSCALQLSKPRKRRRRNQIERLLDDWDTRYSDTNETTRRRAKRRGEADRQKSALKSEFCCEEGFGVESNNVSTRNEVCLTYEIDNVRCKKLVEELKEVDSSSSKFSHSTGSDRRLHLKVSVEGETLQLRNLWYRKKAHAPKTPCNTIEKTTVSSSCSGDTPLQALPIETKSGHFGRPLQTKSIVETNISNLKSGESLYILHARNQWFEVKLMDLVGNEGHIQYCRTGRTVQVVFLENGMAVSYEEFAISRWTFTTPGKRNVGVNLVDKSIVVSSGHADTFTSKIYGFDVATGASEVLSQDGKVLMLLVKDNGVAFEFGTTRKYWWSLATGHKIVGAKQVGKMISVEYKCNDWISGTVVSFNKESQACKVVYENGSVDSLLIQANDIARSVESDRVFKWRKKWVETARASENLNPWPQEAGKKQLANRADISAMKTSNQDKLKPPTKENQTNLRRASGQDQKSDINQIKPTSFSVNQLVRVEERCWAGVNKEGGVGRIIQVHDDGTYSIRFHVGARRTEKHVEAEYIFEYDMFSQEAAVTDHFVLCESHGDGAEPELKHKRSTPSTPSKPKAANYLFVRRSIRRPGLEQLRRPATQVLLKRLRANNPEDKAMRVLRLKNHLEADTNSLVLLEILKLLESNTVVQVLYIHNFNIAMDDLLLDRLSHVLRVNPTIWALNVGENFRITRSGWEKFAVALRDTHVTHLYAGSESTVNGELKIEMRDAIRANRRKHNRHINPENLEVILQIGQMWWNPKNARALRPFVDVDVLCHQHHGK